MSDATFNIVQDLKKLAILSNRLSDVHLKNLQTYPFVFFDDLKSCELLFDINTETNNPKESVVSYVLKFKKGAKIDNLEKRCSALEMSVQNLLWKEVKVEIYKDTLNKRLNDVKER